MILNTDCWVKSNCKKYLNNKCIDSFCIKLFKLDDLYQRSLLSVKQRNNIGLRVDADGTDRDEFVKLKSIQENIEMFVADGNNLYIHSSTCGNGKTAWSIKLIQSYLNKIWYKSDLTCKALFINVPKFLLSLKDNISDKSEYVKYIKDNVLDADLVVWDEIGVSSLTKFEHEHLLNLINNRIDTGKSNIYTSNMNGEELKEKIGDRLYSRVVNMSVDIEFHGVDKRGIK